MAGPTGGAVYAAPGSVQPNFKSEHQQPLQQPRQETDQLHQHQHQHQHQQPQPQPQQLLPPFQHHQSHHTHYPPQVPYTHQPHQPFGTSSDISGLHKRKSDLDHEDADGDYDYDDAAGYATSRTHNESSYSTSEYGTEAADMSTMRVQTRSGKDVRMLMGNHSNINIPMAQSTASSVSSNEHAPPTPGGEAASYGHSASSIRGCVDSPPEGGSSISRMNGNSLGSPAESARKKQKRNKPTLSCSECVERKTKCDRGRPHCLACIKRQTECKYAHVANLLEDNIRAAAAAGGRRVTRPLLSKKTPGSSASRSIPNIADRGILNAQADLLGSVALSTGLLSNVPYSLPSASNVFGIGSEHPFANYWTCKGGLHEVVALVPVKTRCDVLLALYFECFDPVYPLVDQHYFYSELTSFWALPPEERGLVDPAFIGLLFAMLALATHFDSATAAKERKETADFYASASNQGLRLSSYLSSASIRSIQAMTLMTYFLINDNHASDGWAFAGVLMRQAYAMGLHRDPNIAVPNASPYEKQQRRKVWQAVLLQDTFLTVLLSLPPTATHTDVNVDDLEDEEGYGVPNENCVTDTAYVRGSWTLANLVQEAVSSPRSLDLPICSTTRHKTKLVSDFRAIYRSFPDIFRSWDLDSLTRLAKTNKRVVRQTLFLSSNYFHNLMLVHASESTDVPVNIRGTLEAAHDAITSFFMLFRLFEREACVWWVFNHRAFLEALCIGGVLKEAIAKNNGDTEAIATDPLYARARADIERMVEIMRIMGEGQQGEQVAQIRVKVLSEFL